MDINRTPGEWDILSVGIDIGTTTTHLVFSKLRVTDLAGSSAVAKFEITSREIIYESKVYFTPFVDDETRIDLERLKKIIAEEYKLAGFTPQDIRSGAVIITGEAASKENAEEVARALEGLAGDFVVAVAGPDLEAILAGQGSGAQHRSRRDGSIIANLDIGGGTTNIAVFKCGNLWDVATFKVGGTLFTLDPYTLVVRSITPVARTYANYLGLKLEKGYPLSSRDVDRFCQGLIDILDEVVERRNLSPLSKLGLVSGPLRRDYKIDGLIFSGGVGRFVYEDVPSNPFSFGDYGPYLAKFIKERAFLCKRYNVLPAEHTLRATVIGAGVYSMKLSGSTIFIRDQEFLPLRNIPVAPLILNEYEDLVTLEQKLREVVKPFKDNYPVVALTVVGWQKPNLKDIEQLARAIAAVDDKTESPVVVICEGNFGKVLGYFLEEYLEDKKRKSIICLDEIRLSGGEFIDIGKPLPLGEVIPVVVKTLVFAS